MEINTLYSKTLAAASAKVNTKSSDSSNFNQVFERTSQNNQTNQSNQMNQANETNQANQTNQTRQSKTKNVENPKNEKTDDTDNKPLSKDEKDALKQAGMSDDEINGIKSEKDLKETIIKKLLGVDTKENEDLNSLLAMLMTLMNGKFDNADYSKIKDFVKENKNTLVETISNCVEQEILSTDLTKNPKGQLNSDISKLYSKLQSLDKLKPEEIVEVLNSKGDDILEKLQSKFSNVLKDNIKDLNVNSSSGKVQSEFVNALKSKLNDETTNQKGTKDLSKGVKTENQNVQSGAQTNVVAKTDEKSSDTNSGMANSGSKSDEDFLKSLLSDSNSSDKISKVTNFMTQFNNTKVENANMVNVENLVIDKTNLSADIIKTVKFMEINNMKDLTVKINPKELGEVVIKLTMEAGVMKATISATNKEAYNLLNSNLADMTNKLQNTDIKVQSLSLNIYNEDTTFFKDGSNNQRDSEQNKGKKNHAVGAIDGAEDIENNTATIDNNVNILA